MTRGPRLSRAFGLVAQLAPTPPPPVVRIFPRPSQAPFSVCIVFDLGMPMPVGGLKIWNYNESLDETFRGQFLPLHTLIPFSALLVST